MPISAVIREGVWTITQGYKRESVSERVTLSDLYQERQSVWAVKFRVVHLSQRRHPLLIASTTALTALMISAQSQLPGGSQDTQLRCRFVD